MKRLDGNILGTLTASVIGLGQLIDTNTSLIQFVNRTIAH
jgi:hypothetical protein